MPSATSHQSKFVWYELVTRDTPSAAAFYQSVVGWDAKPAGPAHGDYMIFSADSLGIGGVMGLTDEACVAGARSGWVGYIWVEDVDAYAAKVKAAGGRCTAILPTSLALAVSPWWLTPKERCSCFSKIWTGQSKPL